MTPSKDNDKDYHTSPLEEFLTLWHLQQTCQFPIHPTSSSSDDEAFLLQFLIKTCDHAVWRGWWWRWILHLWWHCCLFGSWLLWWRWCSTYLLPTLADKYGICKERDINSRHVVSSACVPTFHVFNTIIKQPTTLFYLKPWAVQRCHGYSSDELLVFVRCYIHISEIPSTATNHKALAFWMRNKNRSTSNRNMESDFNRKNFPDDCPNMVIWRFSGVPNLSTSLLVTQKHNSQSYWLGLQSKCRHASDHCRMQKKLSGQGIAGFHMNKCCKLGII